MTWFSFSFVFFFNDTATTEIYTLSLHDALPIWGIPGATYRTLAPARRELQSVSPGNYPKFCSRSEEHTSELQSQSNLVCRLLLEKKKNHATSSLADPSCASHRCFTNTHHSSAAP